MPPLSDEQLAALEKASPEAHKEYIAMRDENSKLKAKPQKPDPEEEEEEEEEEEQDLGQKAKAERDTREKSSARDRRLESALKFNLGAKDFLKQNEALLPTDAADIFTQAEKEKFEDAIEKDEAIKSGLIQSFFRVQTNVDLLTPGQKSKLDDYLRLTKTGKQEQAQTIYDMVFEPAFEMLKHQKKAAALGRGHSQGSDVEDGYKKRLMSGSRKHYLGEKDA